MGRAVTLRRDFDEAALRRLAKDAGQSRRLVALAEIYDGARRTEAAHLGGVTLQVIRDWVLRFNAEGPDGLIDRPAGEAERGSAHQIGLDLRRGLHCQGRRRGPRSPPLQHHGHAVAS